MAALEPFTQLRRYHLIRRVSRAHGRLASPTLAFAYGNQRAAATSHVMLDSKPVENPLHDPLRFERRVPECVIVIFGANGDLTKRKLMPALYRLAYDRRLSAGFAVVGISRTPLSDDAF